MQPSLCKLRFEEHRHSSKAVIVCDFADSVCHTHTLSVGLSIAIAIVIVLIDSFDFVSFNWARQISCTGRYFVCGFCAFKRGGRTGGGLYCFFGGSWAVLTGLSVRVCLCVLLLVSESVSEKERETLGSDVRSLHLSSVQFLIVLNFVNSNLTSTLHFVMIEVQNRVD